MKRPLIFFFVLQFAWTLFYGSHREATSIAYANGVIVTEPEGSTPKKVQPKKKAPKPATPTPPPAPEIVEVVQLPTLLEQALVLLEQRYFTKATALLLRVVEEEPLNAGAWYALGRAYEARGFFPEAQRAMRRTLEIDPSFSGLSRIMEYPGAGDRKPLWDPSRPARIEEIPVAIDGFTIMPPSNEESSILTLPVTGPDVILPEPVPLPRPPLPREIDAPSPPSQESPPPAKRIPVRVVKPGEPLPGKEKDSPAYTPPTQTISSDTPPVYVPPMPSEEPAPVYYPPAPPESADLPENPQVQPKSPDYVAPAIQPEETPVYFPPAPPESPEEPVS